MEKLSKIIGSVALVGSTLIIISYGFMNDWRHALPWVLVMLYQVRDLFFTHK
jgi:hypothetical protein